MGRARAAGPNPCEGGGCPGLCTAQSSSTRQAWQVMLVCWGPQRSRRARDAIFSLTIDIHGALGEGGRDVADFLLRWRTRAYKARGEGSDQPHGVLSPRRVSHNGGGFPVTRYVACLFVCPQKKFGSSHLVFSAAGALAGRLAPPAGAPAARLGTFPRPRVESPLPPFIAARTAAWRCHAQTWPGAPAIRRAS